MSRTPVLASILFLLTSASSALADELEACNMSLSERTAELTQCRERLTAASEMCKRPAASVLEGSDKKVDAAAAALSAELSIQKRAAVKASRSDVKAGLDAASFRATPLVREGTAKGLRFSSIKPDSLVAKLGLQNEDVLVSAGGKPCTTADCLTSALAGLPKSKSMLLVIERDGVTTHQPVNLSGK